MSSGKSQTRSRNSNPTSQAQKGDKVISPRQGVNIGNLAACGSTGLPLATGSQDHKESAPVFSLTKFSHWIIRHQIGTSLYALSALVLLHLSVHEIRPTTQKFFSLAYYQPNSGRYRIGHGDLYMVLFWITVFTGARVIFMEYPAASYARWAKIDSAKDRLRFAEQAWVFIYYIASWSLGMHIMYQSKYWFDTGELWTDWPDMEVSGSMKWYYLVQLAFWLQQLAVINIEQRRNDHWQMFTHHLVTLTLVFGSYAYRWTRVGNMTLSLMDFVDFILAFAKILRYHKLQFACDCALGVFVVSWFVTRHILFLMVCYSIQYELYDKIAPGCYLAVGDKFVGPTEPVTTFSHILSPFKDLEGMVCATPAITGTFLALMLGLQVILLLWFSTIVRFTYKVITGGALEDPRSEEEDQSVTEPQTVKVTERLQQTKNSEAGPKYSSHVTRGQRKVSGGTGNLTRSTGVHLPMGKEILNRVGCDTKTT